MSAPYPGVRFSIRPQGQQWAWRASLDGALLAEGLAATRAIAAALVIRTICRVSGPEVADSVLAEAA